MTMLWNIYTFIRGVTIHIPETNLIISSWGYVNQQFAYTLKHRIILSHVTALKGRLLPNDNVVEHIYIHQGCNDSHSFDKSNNIFLGVRKPAICLYLEHRIILSHVTALKGRLLPNDNVVEHIYIHQGCNNSHSLQFDSIQIIPFRFRLCRLDYAKYPEFVDLAKWSALAVAQEAGLPQSSPISIKNLIII